MNVLMNPDFFVVVVEMRWVLVPSAAGFDRTRLCGVFVVRYDNSAASLLLLLLLRLLLGVGCCICPVGIFGSFSVHPKSNFGAWKKKRRPSSRLYMHDTELDVEERIIHTRVSTPTRLYFESVQVVLVVTDSSTVDRTKGVKKCVL